MPKRTRGWAQLVGDLESSGLSRAEFCRRRKINYQTMTGWVKRLATDGTCTNGQGRSLGDPRVLSFVELPIGSGSGGASHVVVQNAHPYEVVLSDGRSIRVGADFDGQVLARLIQAVESC